MRASAAPGSPVPADTDGAVRNSGYSGYSDDDGNDDERADEPAQTGVRGVCDCDPETVARVAATAPPLPSIIAASERAAGLVASDDPTAGWRKRSRWSALIPWISVTAGNSQSWRELNDPAIAAISSPSPLNHAVTWSARAGWRLEDLVYDPNEPKFESFELRRRRERRTLAAVTSRAYFTWLRAAVAADRDVRWELRVAEAAAQLDALTDGWFTPRVSRGPTAGLP